MRTTLTLESDVAHNLKTLSQRRKSSFKKVVNEVLRAGLAAETKPRARTARFRVRASHCGFRSGIDLGKLNQLVDELEAEEFASGKKRRR